MLLFSRVAIVRGSPRQAAPWLAEVTGHVNAATPLDVTLWAGDFGFPLGTVVWNATVESQQDLVDGTAALAGDDRYLDILEGGRELIPDAGEDQLRSHIAGEPGPEAGPGAVATVTTARIVLARLADAVSWSTDMAAHITSLTGRPMTVWSNVYGDMGELTFLSVVDSAADAEKGQAATYADPGYLDRMHASGGLFEPGTGRIARFTRML